MMKTFILLIFTQGGSHIGTVTLPPTAVEVRAMSVGVCEAYGKRLEVTVMGLMDEGDVRTFCIPKEMESD